MRRRRAMSASVGMRWLPRSGGACALGVKIGLRGRSPRGESNVSGRLPALHPLDRNTGGIARQALLRSRIREPPERRDMTRRAAGQALKSTNDILDIQYQ